MIARDMFKAFALVALVVALPTTVVAGNVVLYGVVSAAGTSYLCPGALASAYGQFGTMGVSSTSGNPLPTSFGGVQVLVGGKPTPLLYVSPGQVNFQVPYESLGTQATFQVVKASDVSNIFTIALSQSCVGALPNYSNGWSLVTNQSYQVLQPSQVQKSGATLTVWVVGGGQTSPLQATGRFAPAVAAWFIQQVTATCSAGCGPQVALQYAGETPGYVGLGQINFVVPVVSNPGTYTLTFQSGGTSSSKFTLQLAITP